MRVRGFRANCRQLLRSRIGNHCAIGVGQSVGAVRSDHQKAARHPLGFRFHPHQPNRGTDHISRRVGCARDHAIRLAECHHQCGSVQRNFQECLHLCDRPVLGKLLHRYPLLTLRTLGQFGVDLRHRDSGLPEFGGGCTHAGIGFRQRQHFPGVPGAIEDALKVGIGCGHGCFENPRSSKSRDGSATTYHITQEWY